MIPDGVFVPRAHMAHPFNIWEYVRYLRTRPAGLPAGVAWPFEHFNLPPNFPPEPPHILQG